MTTSLADYYATNYTKCQVDDSFLSSWQGLAYPAHSIQVVGLPIQVFTTYLIMKKSPKVMETIKGPLMTAHFWISICDFSLCVLETPYYFLPNLAGFNVGVLSFFNVPVPLQLILILFSIFGMIIAIIALFESRSSSILENRWRIEKRTTRLLYYSLNIVSHLTALVLLFLKIPEDQERAMLQILKTSPCPTREFFTSPTFVFTTDHNWAKVILFWTAPAIAFSALFQIFFHSTCCIYYLYISPSLDTSPETRKLQRRYFMGLALQCSIPLAIFAIPYCIALVALLTNRFTQGMMNMLVVVFGFHGIAESIVVIIVHKSYRKTVKQMFSFRKNTEVTNIIASNELTIQPRRAFPVSLT